MKKYEVWLICSFIHSMLNTNYIEIFRYTACYWRKRRQNGNLLSEEKKTMILPSYMTAEYVKHPKSGYQCSETSINVFVFFTPHLHQRITVFAHFYITLAKVCAHLLSFATTATLCRTIPWKRAGSIIITIIFQSISKFPYFSFSSVSFPCTSP